MGTITPAGSTAFDAMMLPSAMSESEPAWHAPDDVRPNRRTKPRAMRRAGPVVISARDMKKAVITSYTGSFP